DEHRGSWHASLAASAGGRCRQGGCANRGGIHVYLSRDRFAVGPSHLGYLLGMGCAADVDAGAVAALLRSACALLDRRRTRSWGARRGNLVTGRRYQSSHHQVFGRLVEHIASARLGFPNGRINHRPDDLDAVVDHDASVHAPVRDLALGCDAQRDPAASRAQHAIDTGAGITRMSLGPHADFIVAAYAVTLFVVAALIGWVMLDYVAQCRVLEDLEERGVTRRSLREG